MLPHVLHHKPPTWTRVLCSLPASHPAFTGTHSVSLVKCLGQVGQRERVKRFTYTKTDTHHNTDEALHTVTKHAVTTQNKQLVLDYALRSETVFKQ